MKSICIVGLGYIGLPTSIMFAKQGFNVRGVDVNEEVIELLTKKELHIQEPGLQEALEEVIDNGHLTVSTKPAESDVFIIAVPSPITEDKLANLDYVRAATESIVPYIRKGSLVLLESTVPPRTVEDVIMPILSKSKIALSDMYISHSPERVIPGKIFEELANNDRIVGGVTPEAGELTKELYKSFVKGEIHLTDATTAEMVKVIENTYRDINIAFANELTKISDKIGVNVWETIKLANFHPRVNIHQPGPGVGGHCIPVDPWFLAELQPEEAQLIKLARQTNDLMPAYVVEQIVELSKESNIASPRVAILGLSYKGNVDDMRESPSLKVIEQLEQKELAYTVFDPFITDIRLEHQKLNLEEAMQDADLVVVLTDHQVFQDYDPSTLGKLMQTKLVLDTKNCLNEENWRSAGFGFKRLGDAKNR